MGGEAPPQKFGDACIAAPFTSKHSNSIRCVRVILKQGICTLVTTINTYKVLALSSIISAYSMAALNLEALKYSELQQTILGISGAINYFVFSSAKPVKRLQRIKHACSIYDPYFLISLAA